jgi:hypothetical protein
MRFFEIARYAAIHSIITRYVILTKEGSIEILRLRCTTLRMTTPILTQGNHIMNIKQKTGLSRFFNLLYLQRDCPYNQDIKSYYKENGLCV